MKVKSLQNVLLLENNTGSFFMYNGFHHQRRIAFNENMTNDFQAWIS